MTRDEQIPYDPGLLPLRRAVAKLRYLNDSLIWATLGVPLAEELAKVEGSWFGEPRPVSGDARYAAENIDEAIRDFRTIEGMIT